MSCTIYDHGVLDYWYTNIYASFLDGCILATISVSINLIITDKRGKLSGIEILRLGR